MKVTEGGHDIRKPNKDLLRTVTAEQGGQGEGIYRQRIAENNHVCAETKDKGMLEKILWKDNLNAAYKRVRKNKGASGIDGMDVKEMLPYLRENGSELIRQLYSGKYKPNPVRRVEIPKEEKGKTRKLGIPTVIDRMVQQAIAQILTPIYEKKFSDNSFGFRPGRSQHDALKRCLENVNDGYRYVLSMDLAKFFDTVNQSKLIEILSQTIEDGRVISLIHKYLNAGVCIKGMFEQTEEGVPQGGPLSPLLGNIMLNELDQELERRGHRFVRYADDCIIFCKSQRSGERVLRSISKFIEKKLFLHINYDKTVVSEIREIKYLGFSFGTNRKGENYLLLHPKSEKKMKEKIRALTDKNNGWSNDERRLRLKQYITGWINYFRPAKMKKILINTDSWMRRRLRAMYWKQWKKVKTRYRNLRAIGVPEELVHNLANSRKGYWRMALALGRYLTPEILHKRLGYPSLLCCYLGNA